MKTTNKPLVVLLTAIILLCMTGFTANAAENKSATSGTKVVSQKSTVFDGFALTILDKTTPATDMRGRMNDRNAMCFVSADNTEIGVISYNDYWSIIKKHQNLVKHADGSSWSAPPEGYKRWHDWFADEFNKHRNVEKSRAEAVTEKNAETIAKYRQELIKLVNVERENAGLMPYVINETCMTYSQLRVEELANMFSHTRPDGTDAGYEIIYKGPQTPLAAVQGWMNSPGHKAAILNENRVYVGAGCFVSSNGIYSWQMYFEKDPEVYENTLILG